MDRHSGMNESDVLRSAFEIDESQVHYSFGLHLQNTVQLISFLIGTLFIKNVPNIKQYFVSFTLNSLK